MAGEEDKRVRQTWDHIGSWVLLEGVHERILKCFKQEWPPVLSREDLGNRDR